MRYFSRNFKSICCLVAERLLFFIKTLFGCRTAVFCLFLESKNCLVAERLLSISGSKWKMMAKLLFGRRTAAVSKKCVLAAERLRFDRFFVNSSAADLGAIRRRLGVEPVQPSSPVRFFCKMYGFSRVALKIVICAFGRPFISCASKQTHNAPRAAG